MNRLPGFLRQHLAGLRLLLVFTVITGILYPVAMWGLGQGLFHNQVNGSMVSYKGRIVGSKLLCQEFVDAKGNPLSQYFQPRPSAATSGAKNDYGCNPLYSNGSQLGPTNPKLITAIKQYQKQIAAFDPECVGIGDDATHAGREIRPHRSGKRKQHERRGFVRLVRGPESG